MPDQVRPGRWPQPGGTGTQPITVQAICCGGCCLAGFLVFASAPAGIAGLVDARACGNEVKRGKPHPDVMHLALEKLDASPGDAIMIGDTPFDAMAARKVEVRALGLLTGGFSEADLIKAGAETVLPDVGALLEMVRPLPQAGGRKAS
jgi:phosphoglycolate phosphatase-like HAD superfamily hydrolase